MNLSNIKKSAFFLLSTVVVSTASAQNYLVEDDEADPAYFDFVYEPDRPIPPRTNFVKDEIVLLHPADKGGTVNSIAM